MAQKSETETPASAQVVPEKTKSIKVVLPKSIWQKCRARINEDETDWHQFGLAAFASYLENNRSEPESRAA